MVGSGAPPTRELCQACAGLFLSTPSGLAHARILTLAKGNKVAAAELIKKGGGRRVGVGKPSGHWCQVSNAVPTCQVLGAGGGRNGTPHRAKTAVWRSTHPSPCLHLSTQQMGEVCPHGQHSPGTSQRKKIQATLVETHSV